MLGEGPHREALYFARGLKQKRREKGFDFVGSFLMMKSSAIPSLIIIIIILLKIIRK